MTKPAFIPTEPPEPDAMNRDEAALRCAVNLLADSLESGKMPSGLPLEPLAREMHERTLDHFSELLRQVQALQRAVGKDR